MGVPDERSMRNLRESHADLRTLFIEVLEQYPCVVYCGHRGEDAQNAAYHANLSKAMFPDSPHNKEPSMAVDAAPMRDGRIDWNDTKTFYHFGGYVLGVAHQLYIARRISHQVRWGGDWDSDKDLNDQTFNDLVHFELVVIV